VRPFFEAKLRFAKLAAGECASCRTRGFSGLLLRDRLSDCFQRLYKPGSVAYALFWLPFYQTLRAVAKTGF